MGVCDTRLTADSSSAQLYVAEEDCWGQNPLTYSPAPVLAALRFTGESLTHTQESITSDEIRSDSQVTDLVRVAVGAEGDVNFELSYRAFDTLFEGMLRNTWDSEVDINNGSGSPQLTTVVIASPLNQVTTGSPGAALAAVQVGAFIRVSGSTSSPSNNGFYEVLANTGGNLTVFPNFAAPESGTQLRIQLSPQQSLYFTGMRVGSGDMSIVPGEILTGTFGFQGKRGFAQDGPLTGVNGITEVAAPAFEVANAVDNVQDILLDGTALDADLTQMTFSVGLNPRDKPAVGALGNIDIGLGRFNIEGNSTMYFSSRVLYDKYLAFTAHSWSFVVAVGSNSYLVEFPSIKFSNGTILAEGNDGDVVANMDFTARRDPTKGYTLAMNRFSDDVGVDA
jgi:hypothetical protein